MCSLYSSQFYYDSLVYSLVGLISGFLLVSVKMFSHFYFADIIDNSVKLDFSIFFVCLLQHSILIWFLCLHISGPNSCVPFDFAQNSSDHCRDCPVLFRLLGLQAIVSYKFSKHLICTLIWIRYGRLLMRVKFVFEMSDQWLVCDRSILLKNFISAIVTSL